MATVYPAGKFDPEADCQALRDAMSGVGTKEETITNILTRRSVDQRQKIALQYKASFGEDLKEKLHSELSGKYRLAVLYSFYDKNHVNAKAIYRAVKGSGTNERILVDTICSCTKEEMKELVNAYEDILKENGQNVLRRSLEKDIVDDTSGDFEKVLVALCQARREERFDDDDVAQDCADLYKAGEGKTGTDESAFTRILVTRSWNEIKQVDATYMAAMEHDLITAIEKETSGYYQEALSTIVKCARNRNEFYAEVLRKAINGAGTDDETLVRMIMAHAEVDLKTIAEVYQHKYEKSLVDDVEGDTSGDQKSFLLGMLGVHQDD